jgi:hypothetical protein
MGQSLKFKMIIRCYTQKIFNVSPTKSLLNENEKENAFFWPERPKFQ